MSEKTVDKILSSLPLGKIISPGVVLIIITIITSKFITNCHKFNVENNVENFNFPTSFDFRGYLFINLLMLLCYLFINMETHKSYNRIQEQKQGIIDPISSE